MSKSRGLTPAGEEIVEALEGLLATLEAGGDLEARYTVRTYDLRLEPRAYTGEDVRKTRETLGLSQALFARFLGVSSRVVGSWERGEREPSRMAARFLEEIVHAPDYWKHRLDDMLVARGPK